LLYFFAICTFLQCFLFPLLFISSFSFEGLIYIVGGCTHSRRHLQDLLSFNPVTGEWSTLPPMLVPRSQMGVAVLDGYLYVVGGTNRHHEVLQSVERYSFEEVLVFSITASCTFT
jgi:actin-binding protein IPP